jgi:hypothetical protein
MVQAVAHLVRLYLADLFCDAQLMAVALASRD